MVSDQMPLVPTAPVVPPELRDAKDPDTGRRRGFTGYLLLAACGSPLHESRVREDKSPDGPDE